jgi:hypothetical protein
MAHSIHLEPQQVPDVFKRAFPDYTGRTYRAQAVESVTLSGTYWDEGSKSEYVAVNISTGETRSPSPGAFGVFYAPESPRFDLPAGIAIVEHSICCGKDDGIRIYVRPENLAPLLPPAVSDLTRDMAIVIEFTAALKPSYNGISNYRFHSAARVYEISRFQWEDAKAECIAKGYLNKAGAITPAGRNVRHNGHGIKHY